VDWTLSSVGNPKVLSFAKNAICIEKKMPPIVLPLPPKQLNPNASYCGRSHWPRSRAKKQYREAAHAAAIKAGLKNKRLETATIQCKFFFRTAHKHDGDNLLASLKSCFDGLVDAGVFTDDSGLSHLPVETAKDASDPRVEIHILSAD
jgi:Holliday junction resolvase RusA-like endonuclease